MEPAKLPIAAMLDMEVGADDPKIVVKDETEDDVQSPPYEQKYARNDVLFDPTPTAEVQSSTPVADAHSSTPPKTTHDVMKLGVDRALLMYCNMRDHQDDFYDEEVDLIYTVVEQVVSSFLAKLNVNKNTKLSRARVESYLEAYYNLHKLKQAQDRRVQFCSEFEDMFQIGGISGDMQEHAETFANEMEAKAREIDKLVAPKPPAPKARHSARDRSSGPCSPSHGREAPSGARSPSREAPKKARRPNLQDLLEEDEQRDKLSRRKQRRRLS